MSIYTVKQWRSIGIDILEGDIIYRDNPEECITTNFAVEAKAKHGHFDNWFVRSFLPRKNDGRQPVPNMVKVKVVLLSRDSGEDLAVNLSWDLKGYEYGGLIIKEWTPSISQQPLIEEQKIDNALAEVEMKKQSTTQPLIDNQNEGEMSEQSEIHKAWVALKGDLANAKGLERDDNVVVICLSKVGVFNAGDYSTSEWYVGGSNKHWKVICTIKEFTDYCEKMKAEEKRIDIICKKGNDGLHYDNTTQQVDALALNDKPIFTQSMADAGELPPVGSAFKVNGDEDCEDGYCYLRCVATHVDGGVIGQDNYSRMFLIFSGALAVGTRTDKQEAIDEMLSIYNCGKYSVDMAEALYDSSYRKLTPEQAKMYDDKTGIFGDNH